jgi:hypothetical protein
MTKRHALLLLLACCGAAVALALLKGLIGSAADVELLEAIDVPKPTASLADAHQDAERLASGLLPAQRLDTMQDALTRMSEMQRNQVFRLAIRDDGFRCDDVISTSSIGNEGRVCRASCADAGRYLVMVGDLERLVVQPVAWEDAVF